MIEKACGHSLEMTKYVVLLISHRVKCTTSAETLHLKQQLLVLNDYLCRHMNIHYCNAAYDRKLEGGKKSTDVR